MCRFRENVTYASHFSPFSKCAGIVSERSLKEILPFFVGIFYCNDAGVTFVKKQFKLLKRQSDCFSENGPPSKPSQIKIDKENETSWFAAKKA